MGQRTSPQKWISTWPWLNPLIAFSSTLSFNLDAAALVQAAANHHCIFLGLIQINLI